MLSLIRASITLSFGNRVTLHLLSLEIRPRGPTAAVAVVGLRPGRVTGCPTSLFRMLALFNYASNKRAYFAILDCTTSGWKNKMVLRIF